MKLYDFLFAIFIILTVIIYFNFNDLNVDSHWILYSAEQMLQGAKLYIEPGNADLPINFFYNALCILFAKLFSISSVSSYIANVFFLALVCLFLSWKILKEVYPKQEQNIRYYLYGLSAVLTIFLLPDYGEREHLFIIFITPYILMMMYKDRIILNDKHIIAIALFASFGFNIKPHFVLVFIGIELAYMIHCKKISSIFRKEVALIVSVSFIHLFILLYFYPQWLNFAIPLALEAYAPAFKKSLPELLLEYDIILLFITMVLWLIFGKRSFNLAVKILIFAIVTTLIVYLIQQKGWFYHRLHFFAVTMLFILYLITEGLKKDSKIYLFAILPLLVTVLMHNMQSHKRYYDLEKILETLPSKSTIHIVSTDIALGQALLVKNNQKWASRFSGLFMMNAILDEKKRSVENYLFRSLYEDMIKFKTDTIIFCDKYHKFDFYKYFSSDEKIKKLYDMHYKEKSLDGFTILVRQK